MVRKNANLRNARPNEIGNAETDPSHIDPQSLDTLESLKLRYAGGVRAVVPGLLARVENRFRHSGEVSEDDRWSLRQSIVFIVVVNALCWGLIYAVVIR